MKKNIIIAILSFLLVGSIVFFLLKIKDIKNDYELGYDKKVLEQKLLDYGDSIMEKIDDKKIENRSYHIYLRDVESFDYDISMFYNSKTKKSCDKNKSKIEIFKNVDDTNTVNYDRNVYIVCD